MKYIQIQTQHRHFVPDTKTLLAQNRIKDGQVFHDDLIIRDRHIPVRPDMDGGAVEMVFHHHERRDAVKPVTGFFIHAQRLQNPAQLLAQGNGAAGLSTGYDQWFRKE